MHDPTDDCPMEHPSVSEKRRLTLCKMGQSKVPPIFRRTEEGWAKEIEEEWARLRGSANRLRRCLQLARALVGPDEWDEWAQEHVTVSQVVVELLVGGDW